jgi:hypothetical protein
MGVKLWTSKRHLLLHLSSLLVGARVGVLGVRFTLEDPP